VATNVVIVQKDGGSYMRSPVDSVDYDLSTLTGIMDAFIVALFNSRPSAPVNGGEGPRSG
jgi:hypothetical protein